MDKKKIGLLVLVFIVITLFITTDFEIPFVNADSKNFKLTDGFETFIENKIYSEEENLTITEYFCDEYGDCCDFTEDTEGFEYDSKSTGVTDYTIDYSDGKLTLDIKTAFGYTDYWVKYILEGVGLSLIHYDFLEVRAKCNQYTYNPSIYFENQEGEKIVSVEDRFILTNEFQVFTHEIDINDNIFYENTTTLSMVCYEHDGIDLEFYNYEIDYIKFWRNNITDYATSLNEDIKDSWDFSEGDKEGFSFHSQVNHIYYGCFEYEGKFFIDGKRDIEKNDENAYLKYKVEDLNLNLIDYNMMEFRIKTNYTTYGNPSFTVRDQDDTQIHSNSIYLTTEYQTYTTEINSNYGNNDEIKTGLIIQLATSNLPLEQQLSFRFYIEYIKFWNNNLEDKVYSQSQDTSYYRASSGLYSYHHKFDKNHTLLEDFTILKNSSVKIDIPSLEMFPQRINFNIFSNSYFNISLFIGEEEFILYQKTNINSWLSIRKTINRENYLLNETDVILYFKIYTENQYIEDYLEYFIDDLEITYTEAREKIEYDYHTGTGEYLNYWNINATGNYFNAQPSGVGEYAMGEDGVGLVYLTDSNNLFSRRAYHTYKVAITNNKVDIDLYQYTTFVIDKEYIIFTQLDIEQHLTEPEGIYQYTEVSIIHFLVIDGEYQPLTAEITTVNDYFFEGYFNFRYDVNVFQVDYDTISVNAVYLNTLSGNSTKSTPLSFDINTGNVKNTLNVFNVSTKIQFMPCVLSLVFYPCNPTITLYTERSITHSDPVIEKDPFIELPEFPEWDEDHPWLSFFAFCIWFPMIFVEMVLEVFNITFKIQVLITILSDLAFKIPNLIELIITNILAILVSLASILTSLLSSGGLLGSILNGITGIFDFLSGGLWDWLSNFFDNIVSPFSNFWDSFFGDFSFIGGSWGNLMDGFNTGDWDNMPDLWGSMFPSINLGFINLWKNTFGGFYIDFVGFDFIPLISVIKDFFEIVGMIITILIVIYLIHLFKLVGSRQWDRFRDEISGIIKIIVWIVSAIAKIIHWIFEVIWALLDVLIPFT